MIRLNAFITKTACFNKFEVHKVPLIGAAHDRFQIADELFKNDIAYAYPHTEYLYFKGDKEKTIGLIEGLIRNGHLKNIYSFQSSEIEEEILTVRESVIIKPIVYQAFESILKLKGFEIPRKKVKRAIPKINKGNRNKGFVKDLSDEIVVLRGLKYMFEIRSSGYGILWIDLYSPPYDLNMQRSLSPKEIRERGLMDAYFRVSVLKPRYRYNLLNKIIHNICDGSDILILKFPDGDILRLDMDPIILELIEEE